LYGKEYAVPRLADPFSVPGEWFRGNLHVHTTNSDGSMPPERLVAHYENAGWDFLALTDHWHVSRVEPERFPDITVIPGIEVNTAPGSTAAGTNYHIVGLDMVENVPRKEGLFGPEGPSG
jgi:predicted metal-dependent phosphoesterase TrpH